jgi:hypothetical protein
MKVPTFFDAALSLGGLRVLSRLHEGIMSDANLISAPIYWHPEAMNGQNVLMWRWMLLAIFRSLIT